MLEKTALYLSGYTLDHQKLMHATYNTGRTRRRQENYYHINKINTIQQCLQEKYNLTHINIYQKPKLGRATLLHQLQSFATHQFKTRIKTIIPMKYLEALANLPRGTCKAFAILTLQKPSCPLKNLLLYACKNVVSLQKTKIPSITSSTILI